MSWSDVMIYFTVLLLWKNLNSVKLWQFFHSRWFCLFVCFWPSSRQWDQSKTRAVTGGKKRNNPSFGSSIPGFPWAEAGTSWTSWSPSRTSRTSRTLSQKLSEKPVCLKLNSVRCCDSLNDWSASSGCLLTSQWICNRWDFHNWDETSLAPHMWHHRRGRGPAGDGGVRDVYSRLNMHHSRVSFETKSKIKTEETRPRVRRRVHVSRSAPERIS